MIIIKNKNYLVCAIIMFIATIFFGIVAYRYFNKNNISIGAMWLIAALCDFISFIANLVKYKKKN